MRKTAALLAASSLAVGIVPTAAHAQDDLMAMEGDSLRAEVERRYEAGLAMTLDQAIVDANDPRYLWASETKVQCGIAIGYLKSNTRDETSLSKCAMAYDMMMRNPQPRVVAVPPPPPPPPANICDATAPDLIFFEFDSAMPGSEAGQVVDYVTTNAGPCGWSAFRVVGHTDTSGSNMYNQGLSERRAQAVAELMTSRGVPRTAITTEASGEANPRVPTADGVRELQNRRVEIVVSQ